MNIKYLLQKEFLQIRRNSFMPKIILVFPVMIMCVMPWVMNMEVRNIVVEVVDNDRSTVSRQLVQRIQASNYFVFNGLKATYADALHDIEHSKADLVLVIPPQYGRRQTGSNGERAQLLIAANAVNGTKGSIGSSYLSQMISEEGEMRSSQLASALFLYNKHQDYKVFMIPALMGILLMMLCGFLPALNIVGEKETAP